MREDESWRSVLVVGADATTALALRAQLEACRYRVAGVVGRADEVLPRVQAERPSAVLMDAHLPGAVDGVALAEEIFVCEDIPVVLVSASSDQAVQERVRRCGAYGYLDTPVTNAALVATLEMALAKHGELRARRGVARWLHSAFDAVDCAIVGLDDAGRVEFMNREAIELTGWMLMEAKRGAPPWAAELHALPRWEARSLPEITVLETRGPAAARVMAQKFALPQGGSVCMMHRCSPPAEAPLGPASRTLT